VNGTTTATDRAQRWVPGVAGFALLAAVAVACHLRRATATPRSTRPTVLGTRLDSVSPQWATRGLADRSPSSDEEGPRTRNVGVKRSP
jgi:hypothetical protein